MKSTHKVQRYDYSKTSKDQLEYYGLHKKNNRLHVDTKRFKKIGEELGITEFWNDNMSENRNIPYLIPIKEHADDYSINIFREIIDNLKYDWQNEYIPAIKAIKTPEQVGDEVRTDKMMTSSNADDIDDAKTMGTMYAIERSKKYNEVIGSIYYQYIQKVATECDRAFALVFSKKGSKEKDFSYTILEKECSRLAMGDKRKTLKSIKEADAYLSLNKINNFLKHSTLRSYQDLEKYYSDFLTNNKKSYSNGSYAGDWLNIKPDYLDTLFAKLLVFFEDFSNVFFKEDIEESKWNYDDYFYNAFNEMKNPEIYFGIYDKYGNFLI